MSASCSFSGALLRHPQPSAAPFAFPRCPHFLPHSHVKHALIGVVSASSKLLRKFFILSIHRRRRRRSIFFPPSANPAGINRLQLGVFAFAARIFTRRGRAAGTEARVRQINNSKSRAGSTCNWFGFEQRK